LTALVTLTATSRRWRSETGRRARKEQKGFVRVSPDFFSEFEVTGVWEPHDCAESQYRGWCVRCGVKVERHEGPYLGYVVFG
jgi:hypothetical protein